MKIKSTIKKWSLLLLLNLCFLADVNSEQQAYCTPTFINGCSSWNNQSITLDSINWTLGSTSCTVYDYTNLSTTLNTGVAYPMSVTNGGWCGCTVWADFNNDEAFDSTENLYYYYANLTSNHTYNFDITIPSTVNSGTYRMRVLGGWGTDGFNVSANGYGPCGSYQYGAFQDFTVNVLNSPVGIEDNSEKHISAIEVFPNPAVSSVTVLINKYSGNESQLQLLDVSGNVIRSIPVNNSKVDIDINDLSNGVYIISYFDGLQSQNIRLIK